MTAPNDRPIGLRLRTDRLTEAEVHAASAEYEEARRVYMQAVAFAQDYYRRSVGYARAAAERDIATARRGLAAATVDINDRYVREPEVSDGQT